MSERARKLAYEWAADAITTNWVGMDEPSWPGACAAIVDGEALIEVKRIRDALLAASEVALSPEPQNDSSTSSSPGGPAGVPPPAGGPAVPPSAGAVESSGAASAEEHAHFLEHWRWPEDPEHSAARQAPREQEPAAVRGEEGAPERPPPAPTSECADVARWLSLGQPEDERGLLAARFRAHLLECPTCGDRAFRHLADAARSA